MATTRTATAVACVAGGLLYELAPHLVQPTLAWVTPAGMKLYFQSQAELGQHVATAQFALAILPILGWVLASVGKGGTAMLGRYSALVFLAFAAFGLTRMLLVRSLWNQLEGSLVPMVSVSELGHWRWAIFGELSAFSVLLFRLVRRK